MKDMIKRLPVVGPLAARLHRRFFSHDFAQEPFDSSADYWERRYAVGGDSGVGSYGLFADFKAEVLNEFVAQQQILSVIEFGCGDGNQLTLAKYPGYLGVDVSETAIAHCLKRFRNDPTKMFLSLSAYQGEVADVSLSLDVIYHLVEDAVFESHMRTLFNAGTRYVIVYASDSDDNTHNGDLHVRHRNFTRWVRAALPEWNLLAHIPNRYPYVGDYKTGSFADFFIYERKKT
jgi:SAM-dependent methyltransferase